MPARGVKHVAQAYGVTPATVRRWCREFPAAHIAAAATPTLSRRTPPVLTAAEHKTLTGLSFGFGADDFGWTNDYAFVPAEFTRQLAGIGAEHRNAETSKTAIAGLASAVNAVHAAAAGYIGGDDRRQVGGHARRLARVVGVCASRAARDPVEALRTFNDTLAGWGRSGADPKRLTQPVAAAVWNERRLKAEQATEALIPELAAHPECILAGDAGRGGDHIQTHARFDILTGPIFTEPDPFCNDRNVSEAGTGTLTAMAEAAAARVGLRVGTDVEIDVGEGNKGWILVGYRILDDVDSEN